MGPRGCVGGAPPSASLGGASGNAEPVGDAREGGGPPGYRALKEAAGKHGGYAAAKRAAMAQPALWTLSDRHPRATLAAP